jgi:hypothetical protein
MAGSALSKAGPSSTAKKKRRMPSGQNVLGNVRLTIKAVRWSHIESWLTVAKYAFHSAVNIDHSTLEDSLNRDEFRKSASVLQALREVFAIGREAKDKDWPEDWVETEFEDWLHKMQSRDQLEPDDKRSFLLRTHQHKRGTRFRRGGKRED